MVGKGRGDLEGVVEGEEEAKEQGEGGGGGTAAEVSSRPP